MKKLLLWVFIVGSNFWANAQVQVVVVAWQYEELTITQDSLNYKYNAGTNQLQYITDSVPTTNYTTDIDTKTPNNYGYDGSGNMIRDSIQGFFVNWSPYGKIRYILKPSNNRLDFGYNAMQQRVLKRVVTSGDTVRTYYIRDAQGNTMGVYTRHNDSVTWREQYIFGSSRLGLYRADTLVNKGLLSINKFYEGKRNYELTNHLGNVMVVINDRKTDTLISSVRYYNAVVISASDYYPFGMGIDSRTYTATTYRYGFNGKENDKETGEQDYGMRIYDPRIGRFLSVDPISNNYPWYTPYQFAGNKPIWAIDLDGLEEVFMNEQPATDGHSGIQISMKLKRNPSNDDFGKMQYIYIDGSKTSILAIPTRFCKDVEDLEYYAKPENANLKDKTTEFLYGPYNAKTFKPSPSAPVKVVGENETPDKVPIENKAPKIFQHTKDKKPKPAPDIPAPSKTKGLPPVYTTDAIKFDGNSNFVLSGWEEVWKVAENLKNYPNLKVTLSANIGYESAGQGPLGTGPAVWNQQDDIRDIRDKKYRIMAGSSGMLMDIRAQIIQENLIKKGIGSERIFLERGSAFPSPAGRSVTFKFN